METYETLLIVAGAVGALVTIFGGIAKLVSFVRKVVKMFTDMHDELKEVKLHTSENYMSVLQLIIMTEEMPIEERLRAGEKYTKRGGNGAVKAKYKALQHEYEKETQHE